MPTTRAGHIHVPHFGVAMAYRLGRGPVLSPIAGTEAPALGDGPAALARQEDWQFVVVMTVAVAIAAAIHHHAVIQESPFPFGDGPQSLEEVSELRYVEPVDPGDFLLF